MESTQTSSAEAKAPGTFAFLRPPLVEVEASFPDAFGRSEADSPTKSQATP
jgi:hypothetical protein